MGFGPTRQGGNIVPRPLLSILVLATLVLAAQQTPWPGGPNLQALVPWAAAACLLVAAWARLLPRLCSMPLPLAVLVGWAGLGSLVSPAPWISVPAWAEKTLWVVATVMLVRVGAQPMVRALGLPVLMALCLQQAVLALIQTVAYGQEAWGSLGTPNALARFVLMAWPVVVLPSIARGGRGRGSACVLALALLLCLVGTRSRMAWVALGAQLLVMVACRKPGLALALGSLALATGALTAPLLLHADDLQRVWAWRAALGLALAHPLVGTGLGTFASYYRLCPPSAQAEPLATPHNLLLHVACELGMPSLVFLGWLLIQGWQELAAWERRLGPREKAFIRAARLVIVGLAVQALVEY